MGLQAFYLFLFNFVMCSLSFHFDDLRAQDPQSLALKLQAFLKKLCDVLRAQDLGPLAVRYSIHSNHQ